MDKHFIPSKPQNIIIPFLLKKPRAMVCADMGTGKTGAVLQALLIKKATEGLPKVLVIAPLRVAKNTWQNEIKKWSEFYGEFKVSTILGSRTEREIALAMPADIYITNYEALPWLVDYYGYEITGSVKKEYAKWPFKIVILDESTRVKNTSCYTREKGGKFSAAYVGKPASRTKALARIIHKHVTHVWELTGTPSPNGYKDLWGQFWYLDGGKRLGLSKTAFMQSWFTKNSFSEWSTPELREGAETAILNKISDISISISGKDYFNLSETIEVNVPVSMDKDTYALYHKMEKHMIIELENLDKSVVASTAGVKAMKLHQMANGAIYHDDEGNFEAIHDEKLDALESIIEESMGMPLIICYKFKSDLARLRRRFPEGKHLADNNDIEEDFKKGKIPLLFLHPASAGHGIDGFQYATNKIVFYSVDWPFDTREQAIARIGPMRQLQAGFDRPVFVYNILCQDTIDFDIMDRQKNKLEVHEALMLGLKKRA